MKKTKIVLLLLKVGVLYFLLINFAVKVVEVIDEKPFVIKTFF